LPETQRTLFLERETAGDIRLLESVNRLLRAANGGSTGALDRPIHERKVSLPAAPPRSIGEYRVVRELGVGGMGIVYACRPRAGEALVALKTILSGVRTRAFHEGFERERAVLARLAHPNVCRILDAGSADGLPFIVMELVEGEPIDAFCARRELRQSDRLRLFSQVLAGVEYFHREMVIHKDLKPSNILVTVTAKAKILDFGISKFVSHAPGFTGNGRTGTPVPLLTARYASPEQLEQRLSGRRSDIYSLGVVLYELLAGRHPYEEASRGGAAQLLAATRCPPAAPSHAGRDGDHSPLTAVDELLLRALAYEPSRRYGSAGEFLAALRRCLEGEP
jgi:eukaryotic-like serine/threonine-protein kinase